MRRVRILPGAPQGWERDDAGVVSAGAHIRSGCGRRDDGVLGRGAGRVDGVGVEGDLAGRSVGVPLVGDLQAEGFEQCSGEVVGQLVEVDGPDGQLGEQIGVRRLNCVLLGVGELVFEAGLVVAEFGTPFVDVADEVLVEVIDQFEVAGDPLASGVCVGDGAAKRGDPLAVFESGGLSVVGEVVTEQRPAVGAEHVVTEELADGVPGGLLRGPRCWRGGRPGGIPSSVRRRSRRMSRRVLPNIRRPQVWQTR